MVFAFKYEIREGQSHLPHHLSLQIAFPKLETMHYVSFA